MIEYSNLVNLYLKVTNKMSISNLIVVLGPNLLWEANTLKTVSLEHVCRLLLFILFFGAPSS